MSIEVKRGVFTSLGRDSTTTLFVRCNPRSVSQAEAALEAVVQDTYDLDGGTDSLAAKEQGTTYGPKYVSPATATPDGAFLTIDAGDTSPTLMKTVPEILARSLERHGLLNATIEIPKSRLPELLQPPAHEVELWLVPRGANGSASSRRVDVAAVSWIFRARAQKFPLGPPMVEAVVGTPTYPVEEELAGQIVHRPDALTWLWDPIEPPMARHRLRVASFVDNHRDLRVLSCRLGGPGYSNEELVAAAHTFRDIVVGLADALSWAAVALNPQLKALDYMPRVETLDAAAGLPQSGPYWWQLLNPDDVAALATSPEGVEHPGAMLAVQTGSAAAWLTESPHRADVVQSATRWTM